MLPQLRKWLGGFSQRNRTIEGIRARLGLSMAFSLLPFILLGLIQVRSEYQQQTVDLQNDLRIAAEQSIHEAQTTFARVAVLLSIIAPEGKTFDCNSRLYSISRQVTDIESLHRFDANGEVVCSSDADLASQFADLKSTPWFNAISRGETRSSLFLHNSGQGSQLVVAYRADKALGSFDGVLIATIPTSIFVARGGVVSLPPATETALFDNQARALTPSRSLEFGQTYAPLKAFLETSEARPDKILKARDPDGVERFYAASKLEGQNVYAVISAPASSPWFWARNNPIRYLMLPLAAWLTAFAAAMLASERIVIRWIDYLDRIAAIYARGRYTIRPVQAENAPLEIRHLARTMDELADNITRRDNALTEALHEKDALLREIHHRVKNNLQIISSLLSMQQRAVDDPAARAALGDTRHRIAALALIYRTLYQGEDVRHAEAEMFLTELVGHLVSAEALRGPLVKSEIHADPLNIDPEKLAPMALWLVEAISNAHKHAFAGRGGTLKVRLLVDGKTSTLEVEDDGPGMDNNSTGVGVTLMNAFAKQLRGQASTVEAPGGGTIARLVFETPSIQETPVNNRN